MTPHLIALALAVAAPLQTPPPRTASPQSAPPHTARRHVAGWTVTVGTDAFAGQRTCRVEARRLRVDRAALWFDMGRAERTTDVVYRIDGGPPQTLGTARLDPIRLSQDVALNNPSGGEVGLPLASLAGARLVWIRADGERRPTRFDVSHLQDALDLAARSGCPVAADPPTR